MFIDVSKKIKILEEEIKKEYIKRGEYPSINTVNKHIADIDPFKPLYRVKYMKAGEYLDAENLKNAQEKIQQDLRILYESIYEISVNEYLKLRTYLNTQIEELNRLVQQYTNRASILSNFNELGETLFYQDDEFPIIRKTDHYEIPLKDIKYMPNSYVGFIIEHINMEEGDVIIKVGDNHLKPYNVNKDKLIIPYLDREMHEHVFELDEKSNVSSPVQIPIKSNKNNSMRINNKNKYIISSGKDKASVIIEGEQHFININELNFEDEAMIEFYLVGGSYIKIRSNKEFKYSNFDASEESIDINNYVRKIKITTLPNTIINIDSYDGKIFAMRTEGLVINKKLYYNEYLHDNSFFIEEYLESDRVEIDTKILLYPSDNTSPKIESIEVKESLNIGGGIYD